MAYNKEKADAPMKRRGGMRRRKKVCVFCGEENAVIDFKDTAKLRSTFLREERSCPDVSPAPAQSTRELLPRL